jgi:CBS domain-containing protein
MPSAKAGSASGTIAAIVANSTEAGMQVRDGMSKVVLTVGPGHTLRQAAKLMAARNVGAAVVLDPDGEGHGILTERDILISVGQGEDPDAELVAQHLTSETVSASPGWSLERAAAEMVRGSFRHVLVADGGDIVGVLSMRDIVRCWTSDGASSDVPNRARAAGVA